MKINNFNKIGGTEYRVSNQINGYISFANYVVEAQFLSRFRVNNDLDFKEWAKDMGIYDYGSSPIKRIQMVLRHAEKVYKVIKKDEFGKYVINFSSDDPVNDILNNLTEGSEETCIAFKAMLNFMLKNPSLRNSKKISKAFFVYQSNDDFLSLYNSDILDDISNETLLSSSAIELLNNYLGSRKPTSELKRMCENIVNKKNSFAISHIDFGKLKITYLNSFNDKNDFETFIHSSTHDQIFKRINKNRLRQLLEGDYLDLFNRLMWGLNLAPSSSKNVKEYSNDNLHYEDTNRKYKSILSLKILTIPYSKSTVDNYLRKINDKDFNFMNDQVRLAGKPRADITEYFVGLKFCYYYDIPPNEVRNFINASLDVNLFPVSHAPGGKADMSYKDDSIACSIETTLHDSISSICNHECRPCILHLDEFAKSKSLKQVKLILVQSKDSHPDLVKWFQLCGEAYFNACGKSFSLQTYNFEQVAAL